LRRDVERIGRVLDHDSKNSRTIRT
jgi:hypothetical protein